MVLKIPFLLLNSYLYIEPILKMLVKMRNCWYCQNLSPLFGGYAFYYHSKSFLLSFFDLWPLAHTYYPRIVWVQNHCDSQYGRYIIKKNLRSEYSFFLTSKYLKWSSLFLSVYKKNRKTKGKVAIIEMAQWNGKI